MTQEKIAKSVSDAHKRNEGNLGRTWADLSDAEKARADAIIGKMDMSGPAEVAYRRPFAKLTRLASKLFRSKDPMPFARKEVEETQKKLDVLHEQMKLNMAKRVVMQAEGWAIYDTLKRSLERREILAKTRNGETLNLREAQLLAASGLQPEDPATTALTGGFNEVSNKAREDVLRQDDLDAARDKYGVLAVDKLVRVVANTHGFRV